TGELQQLVHLQRARVGQRAVVLGAELVSWSAVLTLREAGCRTVAMTTRHERSESYAAFRAFGRSVLRVPVLPRTRIVAINGKGRMASVLVEHLDTGRRRLIECDTVITTGDWIPDHELVRTGDLDLDPATLGPVVDTALRTSAPGVFAIGNLVHPVDTADIAALDGRHVVGAALGWLDARAGLDGDSSATIASLPRVVAAPPLRWVTPQRLDPMTPAPRGDLLLWTDELRRRPRLRAVQDGRIVGRRRIAWPASPGRVFRVPASLLSAVDPAGGPVTVEFAE
ncbi:MAG: NAD(P)/FAD-dependent oxidoreductase, partial [Phycicoccus sp.]